jgi:putative membrane protein
MPTFQFQTGAHYQVHRSYIFMGPMVVLVVGAVILLGNIQDIGDIVAASRRAGVDAPLLLIAGALVAAALVLYGVMLGFYAWSYKHLSYVFDEGEFSLYSGILSKKRVHVPYARVQSLNQKAGILQRIVGVCTVSVETAGGAQNKAVRVPYVTLDTAEAMRAELFLRKALASGAIPAQAVAMPSAAAGERPDMPVASPGVAAAQSAVSGARGSGGAPVPPGAYATPGAAPAGSQMDAGPNVLDVAAGDLADWRGLYGGAFVGMEPVTYEMGLTNRELLYTSLTHSTTFVVALVAGLTMLGSIMPAMWAVGAGAFFATVLSALAVVATAVAAWAAGAVGLAISYGKFHVCRRGSRIEVERGLLQRNFSGIDISRVQSIEVRQSFVRRLMGYCEVSLGRINSASQDASNTSGRSQMQGLVIHPFVKLDQVGGILHALVPEFSDMPQEAQMMALPKVALRRSLLRRCVWYNPAAYIAIAVAALLFFLGPLMTPSGEMRVLTGLIVTTLVVCALVTAVLAVSAALWARDSRFIWNRGYVTIRNGGLGITQVCVPRPKVQNAATRSNPFQRRLDLTSLLVTTAAGQGSTTTRLLDVPQEAGDAWLTWLQPRVKTAKVDHSCG